MNRSVQLTLVKLVDCVRKHGRQVPVLDRPLRVTDVLSVTTFVHQAHGVSPGTTGLPDLILFVFYWYPIYKNKT